MQKPLSPPERLARQQAHVAKLQLWNRAHGHHSGPKTASGKARSAMRGTKHGLRSKGGIAMAAWLASVNRLLRDVEQRAARIND